jgi:hypothetical protein
MSASEYLYGLSEWYLRKYVFCFPIAKHLYFPVPLLFKGIASILFLKTGLKQICRKKNYNNHLRSNNYEVCTAVACCFPDILIDVIVLENINFV